MINPKLINLLLADHHNRTEADRQEVAFRQKDCLSLSLARARALDDELELAKKDREHLKICHQCQALVAQLEERLAHPTLWHLLLHVVGQLPAVEARLFQDHLAAGACRRCRERLAPLEALRDLVQRIAVPPRTSPAGAFGLALHGVSAAWQVPPPGQATQGPGPTPDLRWPDPPREDWREAYPWRSPDSWSRLGLYALEGPDLEAPAGGLLLLSPLSDGGYSARLGQDNFAALPSGAGQQPLTLTVCPLDLAQLHRHDAQALQEALSTRDPVSSEAWQEWCRRAPGQGNRPNEPIMQVIERFLRERQW